MFDFWPKASLTVACGNATGEKNQISRLANGHIQSLFLSVRGEYGLQPKPTIR